MSLHITNAQRAEVLTQALPYIQKYYNKKLPSQTWELLFQAKTLITC
jgi:hypothetical protein